MHPIRHLDAVRDFSRDGLRAIEDGKSSGTLMRANVGICDTADD